MRRSGFNLAACSLMTAVQAANAKKCKWTESKEACTARLKWSIAVDASDTRNLVEMGVPLFVLASVVTLVSAMAYFHRPGHTVGALKLLMPRRDGPDWQSALREQLESASVVSTVTALIAVDISCSLLVMLAELEALEGVLKESLVEHAESIGAILSMHLLVHVAGLDPVYVTINAVTFMIHARALSVIGPVASHAMRRASPWSSLGHQSLIHSELAALQGLAASASSC